MYTVIPSLFLSSPLTCLCNVSVSLGVGVGSTLPGADGVRKPPGPWKVSDLDIVVDPVPPSLPESHLGPGASSGSDGTSRECTVPHKQEGWQLLNLLSQLKHRVLSMLWRFYSKLQPYVIRVCPFL